jgi:SAM-dependent methyltransferase
MHATLIEEATRNAKSITHKHILSAINTKIRENPGKAPYRILDAGCGNCELIAYLETFVPRFNEGFSVEVHGFDVFDSNVQFSDFHVKAKRMLSETVGGINWESRIKITGSRDLWPFEDESFDIVVSNQVVEHIQDHDFFFSQNWRVLGENGFSIHLFPVKNYIVEGHIHLPFVHRFKQWPALYRYIKLLSSLRLGKWKHISNKCTLDDFSKSYADFLTYYCNYVSVGDLLRLGKKNAFRTGFNFTGNFYYEKLKEIFKVKHRFIYKKDNPCCLSIHLFKYIQCITLFLEKAESYDNYIGKYCAGGDNRNKTH